MIAVVYGTTGELIKLAPVLRSLKERDAPVITICTGQQIEQIPPLLADFDLPQPELWIGHGHRGRDLERATWVPRWLSDVVLVFAGRRREVRARLAAEPERPLVLVHGDTFTTVIGALIGRALRVPVAHLEAGLRSGNWRDPFPEELDRRAAARLAVIHFAAGEQAAANLRRECVKGEIVDTGANTICDALELVPAAAPTVGLPRERFGLVSLHRFELLERSAVFREILELLHQTSRRVPLLFVNHPVTAAAIADQGLGELFDERFRRVPRQRYFHFISLLKASSFLVTDSGGSQEECAYLGHPCLVHRARTERPEGLGGPVVLSGLDRAVAADFLADPLRFASSGVSPARRPTDVVIDTLERLGYLRARTVSPLRASAV
jgi:UDP-N-acetylglucosamine 2-epimerase (non-hydrolysing)